MGKINPRNVSDALPETGRSKIAGQATGVNVKVLRIDASPFCAGQHAHDEDLLVPDGAFRLAIGDEVVAVSAGEIFFVPIDMPHAVASGSHGTL